MAAWTHRRLFTLLEQLSPLRVISICGPSVFEAICDFGRPGFARGHMNAMTPAISSAVPIRPRGIFELSRRSCSSVACLRSPGVSVQPG